jgi:alkylation response protein AidB-like acyl-CoA dehydrogenase
MIGKEAPIMDEVIDVYREGVRTFLNRHAPNYSGVARHGLSVDADLALGRAWQRLKSEHGYAAITLPRALGGGGGTQLQKVIFNQEEAEYDLPVHYFGISLGQPIPIMVIYATEEQKAELVPPAIRGDTIWCQMFSEPAAGSDLAALRLSARRVGDNWVLNGQKLWTSWAHLSDWGIVLGRHDPSLPKHKGLTYFFVNMRSPGVRVRPVRLLGPSHVNEVFFDDVVIPDSQRLGAVGDGFKLAIHTLMIERYSVMDRWGYGPDPAAVVRALKNRTSDAQPALRDPELRDALAQAIYEERALAEINRRAFAAMAEGQEPGPEGSITKLVTIVTRQRLARAVMNAAGPESLQRIPGAGPRTDFTESWITGSLSRIAGGTDQILRNTIAEKILGLPQDYRPDKGVPFNQIATDGNRHRS